MEKFSKLTAKCMPLALNDVDTDLIIPAQFLTSVSRDGYGENLFKIAREQDPKFPSNDPKYKGAEILVTAQNFGCGSSREHAVWAIVGAGFRVVIAKSFADIFFNNSGKNGLLLITLEPDVVDELLESSQSGDFELSVDLAAQTVTLPDGRAFGFDYDAFRKHCMLEGLDDIDYITSSKADVDSFRQKQDANRYFSTCD
jgi:3-isopropylmalate/(R)-2-methylmalate dehydratase small subunit